MKTNEPTANPIAMRSVVTYASLMRWRATMNPTPAPAGEAVIVKPAFVITATAMTATDNEPRRVRIEGIVTAVSTSATGEGVTCTLVLQERDHE